MFLRQRELLRSRRRHGLRFGTLRLIGHTWSQPQLGRFGCTFFGRIVGLVLFVYCELAGAGGGVVVKICFDIVIGEWASQWRDGWMKRFP